MSGEPLMLTIELQLCLAVASTLNGMKNTRKATIAESDGMTRAVRPGLQLPTPASIPYCLCETASCACEPSVPARKARTRLLWKS